MRSVLMGFAVAVVGATAASAAAADRRCGTHPGSGADLLALHRLDAASARASAAVDGADRDVDDVAILEDRGDLVARRRLLDLSGRALRFVPNREGGFDATPVELGLETGTAPVVLGDDDALAVELPFAFPFFGAHYTHAFVHSDGTLSFDVPDLTAGERGLGRLLAGPPQVAPFLADLAPAGNGGVAVSLTRDRAVASWSDVPEAGSARRNSFSVTLHADGAIDFVYGRLETSDAVVGLSPGRATSVTAADLSRGEPRGSAGALVERFASADHLDLVATAARFLSSHPDVFEQLVIYTTRPLNPQPGSLAFQVNVRNEVQGIGLEVRDDSRAWGSSGALASVVYMDAVDTYRDVDGFEILGHEVAHRWLARLRFRDESGAASSALLGRSAVHWSFFLDSDASVLEGNRIVDRGRGAFETTGIVEGYSPLDLYGMGLVPAAEVRPFFHVAQAGDFEPDRSFSAASGPEGGVRFTGVRRDVTIDDVIAVEGPRVPAAGVAAHRLRQAFVLVAEPEAPADASRVAILARIRSRFGSWYSAATGGRGVADSTLP